MLDKHGYRIDMSDPVCYVTETGTIDIAVRGYEGFYPFLSDGSISPYPLRLDTGNVISLQFGSLPFCFVDAYVQFRSQYE